MGTRVKCRKCGDIIEGDKRGHLISCKCGNIYIDENLYYTRFEAEDLNDVIELDENDNEKGSVSESIKLSQKTIDILDNKKRIDKINYYLKIAEEVLARSTCLKRRYGSVLVKNDEIVSSGYNGAPRGILACSDCGYCRRENIERGKDYSDCPAVHSEMNAIISASRQEMIGADLYLVGIDLHSNDKYVKNPAPCSICKRLIINAGIARVFVRTIDNDYKIYNVDDWKVEDLVGGY